VVFEKRAKARRQTGPARPWRLFSAPRRLCQVDSRTSGGALPRHVSGL